MKLLRITASVVLLVLASAVHGSAQTNVFVNGNTTFTVTWQGVKESATLLATATFTVSNWTGNSFVMTVTGVGNTMPTSPNINARLTAFGFGLTPEGNFSNLVNGSIYTWAFTNFPAFQRVDVCLTTGSGCAGGASGGLNQGQSTSDSMSVLVTGAFPNGVTITPIPAKFQTSLGSLETDGVVIDPPPLGASDLTITKTHTPSIAIPGEIVTYTVTVSNVGSSASTGTVTVTETPPAGLTITALSGAGWICTVASRTCTRSDPLAPAASYPQIAVTTTVGGNVPPGSVTNVAVVSGGGDSNSTNNSASDPVLIAAPAPGMDLTIAKTHTPNTVVPGQTFAYSVTVLNVGTSPSSGTVTVTETPPAGLTVTAISGPGWSCTLATRTCTRSDPLAPTASYPAITVTTLVGAGVVPGTVTNVAVVSGGGDPNGVNNSASDPTIIASPQAGGDLTLTKVPSVEGVVVVGQVITLTLRVTNVGGGSTSGTVTVTEAPPPGLSITALSGPGWVCVVVTQTCIRADVLAPGLSYPDIIVTATVTPDAVGTITNRAVVTGGGDSNPSNGTGNIPITIAPLPVPALPLAFVLGLMALLLAIGISVLRARVARS